MKNELVLTGYSDLSPAEVAELQALLPPASLEVHLISTKSTALDLVQIVFHDFSAVGFVRDALLSKLMAESYHHLKPAIHYLLRKRPAASICIEKFFDGENDQRFSIYLVATPEKIEQLLQELEYIPRERLISQSDKCFVMVRYDEDGLLEITDMGA